MIHLIVVEVWDCCDFALTRQTMSWLLADSKAPRSTMVNSSRPYLTVWGIKSTRGSWAHGLALIMPTAPPSTTRLAPKAIRILVRLLHLRALGRREGPWLRPLACSTTPGTFPSALVWVGT